MEQLNKLPRQRIASVDAFRGLTFLLMLFVNFLAGARAIPDGIHHVAANVDGMGLADIVFPGFLFAVGMSIPFGMHNRISKGDSFAQVQGHLAYRALALVIMGFFMVNAESGYHPGATGMPQAWWSLAFYAAVLLVWGVYRFDSARVNTLLRLGGVAVLVWLALIYRGGADGSAFMAPHWWGILGLIGWAYLFAGLLYQLACGRVAWLVGAIALCLAVHALAAGYTSVLMIEGHATHTAIALCGVVCALLFFDGPGRRFGAVALFAAVLILAGWLLHRWFPVSKIGATPPWALWCSALCVLLFALLYCLIEVRQARRWPLVVEPAASSPLITYLLPFVLEALMASAGWHWNSALTEGTGALLFAVVFSFAVVALVAGLNKLNFKLKI